ncbi:DUF5956 family protein [Microbacterium pullorum]|uniref:DUF5956 family protein n=1 Tax=Microbacterium pullorum TaxID=2762236 RepID=UPI00384DE8B1
MGRDAEHPSPGGHSDGARPTPARLSDRLHRRPSACAASARQFQDVVEWVDNEPPVTRRPNETEIAEMQESLASFLAEFDILAPPAGDEWRLYLPPGVSESDICAAVNGPEVRHKSEASAPEVRADLRVQLARALGPLE